MKTQSIYRRFNLMATLAVVACIGMLIFQSVFVFELYRLELHQFPVLLRPIAGIWLTEIPVPEPEADAVAEPDADDPAAGTETEPVQEEVPGEDPGVGGRPAVQELAPQEADSGSLSGDAGDALQDPEMIPAG